MCSCTVLEGRTPPNTTEEKLVTYISNGDLKTTTVATTITK